MEVKNHVGRPTNEEVAKRKQKQLIKVTIFIIIFLALAGGVSLVVFRDSIDFSSMMGNSASRIRVTGIKLDKNNATIYRNQSNTTVKLTATVLPNNATNKTVTWTSSNPEIATVNNNGLVSAKSTGQTTITAKTNDGKKVATATITVRKKVIIVVGASQVTRMLRDVNSYSSSKYNYSVGNKTLIYVNKPKSGIDYQINGGEGYKAVKKEVTSIADARKPYVEYHIFYPLSGNTIRKYNCSQITKTNSEIVSFVNGYEKAIKELRDSKYSVKGYVVSMHPDVPSQAKADDKVVVNNNDFSCTEGYRSNRKYYKFNLVVKSLVESKKLNYLEYQPLFISIMQVNDPDKNYSYKIKYNTDDGVHWVPETTRMYVKKMLDYSGDL